MELTAITHTELRNLQVFWFHAEPTKLICIRYTVNGKERICYTQAINFEEGEFRTTLFKDYPQQVFIPSIPVQPEPLPF